MKKYNIIFFLVLLLSCQQNLEVNLGDNYFYSQQSENNNYIILKDSINKGVSDFVIMFLIMDYSYDDNFILVLRNNIYGDNMKQGDSNIWIKQSGDTYQFWIVEKKKQKTFGPLNINEYMRFRDSLKISKKLKIEL